MKDFEVGGVDRVEGEFLTDVAYAVGSPGVVYWSEPDLIKAGIIKN